MSQKRVAEIIIETLVAAGVKRIYGVVGDSLNGLLEEIRKREDIEWIGTRHEETAAFAAGAEAHVTGELAVCAGSCGPGNMHLINGLYDCHRSRVPVLAIAAHIPSNEIGSSYFQETHPDQLFRDCSDYCELISQTTQVPASGLSQAQRRRQAGQAGNLPVRRRNQTTGRTPQQDGDSYNPGRRWLRRRSRRIDRDGWKTESAHRFGLARTRAHPVRQSL